MNLLIGFIVILILVVGGRIFVVRSINALYQKYYRIAELKDKACADRFESIVRTMKQEVGYVDARFLENAYHEALNSYFNFEEEKQKEIDNYE